MLPIRVIMVAAIAVEIKGVIDGNRSNSYKVTVLG